MSNIISKYSSKKQDNRDLPEYRLYSGRELTILAQAINAIPMEERIAAIVRFGEEYHRALARKYPMQYCQNCYKNLHECTCSKGS